MKQSPLQLSQCYFTKVEVVSQPNVDPKGPDPEYEVEPVVWSDDADELSWYASVSVKMRPARESKPCFLGEVTAFGVFRIHPKWQKADREKLVFVNGSGILYGAIREMVSNITARSFYAALSLPTWSFATDFRERQAVKSELPGTSPASISESTQSPPQDEQRKE